MVLLLMIVMEYIGNDGGDGGTDGNDAGHHSSSFRNWVSVLSPNFSGDCAYCLCHEL